MPAPESSKTAGGWLTGRFPSFDGTNLFYRYYPAPPHPSLSPHGGEGDLLLILHGHGEHGGRYEKFAPILKEEKLNLACLDYRGSGRSEGRPVYAEHFEDYLKDVTAFTEVLRKEYALSGKLFLFGHSVGGLVAVFWAFRFPEKVRALFLSSPCLGFNLPKFLIGFNHFVDFLMPGFLYQNPVYPPHLTHNPEEVEQYQKDPLIQRKISARLLRELVEATRALEKMDRVEFPFPLFILMAETEKVVDPAKTKLFFEKVKAPLKEMKVFAGYYHEIFNELGQEKVFDALKSCLRAARGSGA